MSDLRKSGVCTSGISSAMFPAVSVLRISPHRRACGVESCAVKPRPACCRTSNLASNEWTPYDERTTCMRHPSALQALR